MKSEMKRTVNGRSAGLRGNHGCPARSSETCWPPSFLRGLFQHERLKEAVGYRAVLRAGRRARVGPLLKTPGPGGAQGRLAVVGPERVLQGANHGNQHLVLSALDPLGHVAL